MSRRSGRFPFDLPEDPEKKARIGEIPEMQVGKKRGAKMRSIPRRSARRKEGVFFFFVRFSAENAGDPPYPGKLSIDKPKQMNEKKKPRAKRREKQDRLTSRRQKPAPYRQKPRRAAEKDAEQKVEIGGKKRGGQPVEPPSRRAFAPGGGKGGKEKGDGRQREKQSKKACRDGKNRKGNRRQRRKQRR